MSPRDLSHEEYLAMVAEINRLRNQVHLFNVEEISETALDDLKHTVSRYESLNPDKISPNSPNYVVAGGVAKGFQKFTHKRRMISLVDIFSEEELVDWQDRWLNFLEREDPETYAKLPPEKFREINLEKDPNLDVSADPNYVCEPKLDGLAISLHYKDGKLTAGVTRGDGFEGELVTENIKQIRTIPKEIPDLREIEVRGEIFLTKKDFEDLNKAIIAGQKVGKMGKTGPEATFANPRNAASGTIRQLDSQVVAERNLSFVAYNLFVG